MAEPASWRHFWTVLDHRAQAWRAFERLGWKAPTTSAAGPPGQELCTRKKGKRLFAETHLELLRQVEQAEVTERAARLEREDTRLLAMRCGYWLKVAKPRCWRVEHRQSGEVLEADSGAGLRAQLRLKLPDPAPDLPYVDPADMLEVAHAG